MIKFLRIIYWQFKDKKYRGWFVNAYLKFFYRKFSYTKIYFFQSNIQKNLYKFIKKNNKNNILEIGTYEGLASIWLAKKYLNNKLSSLTIVDPFMVKDRTTDMKNYTEDIFKLNFEKFQNNKIKFYKNTSDDFFKFNTQKFNLIYIDGSHELDDIKKDLENSDLCLEKGGIIWCDDYKKSTVDCYIPIDEFLRKNKNRYKVIFKDYQIAFQKI